MPARWWPCGAAPGRGRWHAYGRSGRHEKIQFDADDRSSFGCPPSSSRAPGHRAAPAARRRPARAPSSDGRAAPRAPGCPSTPRAGRRPRRLARRGDRRLRAARRRGVDRRAPRRAPGRARPVAVRAGAAAPVRPPAWRYDLTPNAPDLAAFPRTAWVAAIRRVLATLPDADLDYPDARGPEQARRAWPATSRARAARPSTPSGCWSCSGFTQALASSAACWRVGGRAAPGGRGPVAGRRVGDDPAPAAWSRCRCPSTRDGIVVEALAAAGVDARARDARAPVPDRRAARRRPPPRPDRLGRDAGPRSSRTTTTASTPTRARRPACCRRWRPSAWC